jgi:hypothetical protein
MRRPGHLGHVRAILAAVDGLPDECELFLNVDGGYSVYEGDSYVGYIDVSRPEFVLITGGKTASHDRGRLDSRANGGWS